MTWFSKIILDIGVLMNYDTGKSEFSSQRAFSAFVEKIIRREI